ncbi:FAD-binding protein [Candidatus Acetothermia bacterium]|nr:FAD-binding protein [Candidatus Acetothermia bacterium]MBI3660087.1 FAD-binding protein [Candidatus Acetothermia bacterium]
MSVEKYEVHEHDVIIIGAGGAGLRAAIEASALGCSVGLICKSLLGKAHTVMAEGGVAAALANVDPQDGWQVHFGDTMRGGQFINNYRMAELHAKESPARVYELEEWGALFDRTPDGKIMQRPFGAHTYRRLCHVGDRTGLEMIRTLQDKTVASGVEVYMETTLTRLLKDGNRIAGAFGYVRETGRFVLFKAKAVVLATGGWGKVFKVSSNSWECTGDGVMMAYDAGAELIDMEMVQFHPTGMVWPPGVRGILVTEGVRGEGGILKNNKGERFMERYDPKKLDLSSRDVVARAIYTEVQEGRGSEHGGAYLDITHRGPEYIKKKLPSMHEQFLKLADVDITKQPMEVAPTIHYAMGGVRVEPETSASTVSGLFAAGEVAGGLHGANRLGGNSLSDLLVFGRRAGEGAAKYVKSLNNPLKIDEAQIESEKKLLLRPFNESGTENPYQIHEELQNAMQEGAGLARTTESLEKALKKILELQQRAQQTRVPGSRLYNPGWHTARDIVFMLTVSEAIVRCAIERKESRGAHWRKDFLSKDETWGKQNLVTYKDTSGAMKIKMMPTPQMPAELAQLFQQEPVVTAKK